MNPILSGVLALAASAIPGGAPLVKIAELAITYGPAIVKAIEEGRTAWEAAQHAAPELVPHLKALASRALGHLPQEQALEVAAKHVFAPRTLAEEERLFARADGSGFGGSAG